NPRKPYDADTGSHWLWMTFGGSMGQGGVFGVDVVEGLLREDFTGRRWDVTVTPAKDVREQDSSLANDKQAQKKRDTVEANKRGVLGVIDESSAKKDKPIVTRIRQALGISGDRMNQAVYELVQDGILERYEVVVPSGVGGKTKRKAEALRLKTECPDREDKRQ